MKKYMKRFALFVVLTLMFTTETIYPASALDTCEGYVSDENSWCYEKFGDAFKKGVEIGIASEPDDRSTYLPALYIGCENKKLYVQLYNSEANMLASGTTGYIKFDSGSTIKFQYSSFTSGDGIIFADPLSFVRKFATVKKKIDIKVPSNYYNDWVVTYKKANYSAYKSFLTKQGCRI